MNKINPHITIDDDFDPEVILHRRKAASAPRRAGRSEHAVNDEILRYAGAGALSDEAVFSPTYQGSRFEREWILNYLGGFYDQSLITDVLRRVKGGKEANVYCCLAHPATGMPLLAAKLYRPRMLRNLRNDARYRQGRDYLDEYGKVIRDQRLKVAIRKGTEVGKEAVHTSWLEHEYRTLELLRAAGCSVPRPVAVGSNTILMEYIGDEDLAAPTLHEVRLPARQARGVFDRLLEDINKMLAAGRVHGDLSAYNVLYWQGQARIIDLPQAVDPRQNPDAWDIFQRDVTRLCQYFQNYGLGRQPEALAADLWDRYAYPRGPEAPPPDEEEGEEEAV
jgi:RIO kinase 1